jgi:serine phosphatase RsbU (regulator of sigma subunit)
MSIHLARQFAQTNNNLEKKLVEVKSLSAKSIEQEKEKQKILETQKETLETQVKERTSEIVEQKKVIEEKNKDITDSISYAKTIQEAILPTKDLKNKLFPNSFILFKPKDIVSGDFFWFAEKNGKKIIAACDCTGHGVPGALMSMIGNNILHHIVNEKEITAPDEILNHLHREIRKTLNQAEQNETKDGMDIAILTFNSESEIEFAGAQRPLWIVNSLEIIEIKHSLSNDQTTIEGEQIPPLPTPNSKLTEIKGDKFAIGGWQSETERKFTNHKISLDKGDCLYISSDGFADQFSDIDKKLMTSRFKELLLSIQLKSMGDQKNFLDDFIEKWRGKREQIDDILVIGIRV